MKRYFAVFLLLTFSLPGFAAKKPLYEYFRVGAMEDVADIATTPGTVLMGGGIDVDAAFQWMCTRSGNGDFLVIRATGTDAYNPYIQELCPSGNSVATLIIPTIEAANSEEVIAIINRAEAIWIAGGDQSNCINYWKGTPVQEAINARILERIPVGGTSAGLDVLTQFIYSAQANKGVTSKQALADPFSKFISLDSNFVTTLPFLSGIIGDSHFITRDRLGRDIAFLCRIYDNGWSNQPRGISVDEETALLIDEDGTGKVVGNSHVYFLQAPGEPEVCESKRPLTYKDIHVYRINAQVDSSYDLFAWQGFNGTEYNVSAIEGVLTSDQDNLALY